MAVASIECPSQKAEREKELQNKLKLDKHTISYIDDLFNERLIRREMYTSYSEAFDARQREDKVRPAHLAQALPRQSNNEIVNRHISRFNLD
ncbi:hypothetical protein ACJMK2_031795 [Sinanodonta woodiana]|uniref:Uncharacterized protein n=1 Tax=Sinanodonta woodiana TaxID=1069815 RepID=A0ABD3WZ74_SINWO